MKGTGEPRQRWQRVAAVDGSDGGGLWQQRAVGVVGSGGWVLRSLAAEGLRWSVAAAGAVKGVGGGVCGGELLRQRARRAATEGLRRRAMAEGGDGGLAAKGGGGGLRRWRVMAAEGGGRSS